TTQPVSRIGVGAFVILCKHLDRPDAHLIALAKRICGQLSAHITTEKHTLRVTVSVGIMTVSAGEDADALIRQADRAMYIAKQRGPGNYHLLNTCEPARPV